MANYHTKSKVEVKGLTARYYDGLINIITFGRYPLFIEEAIGSMKIRSRDRILDLGTGTGRNACLMMKYLSKEGELIGVDISEEMISQFKKKCANFPNAKIVYTRVDRSLPFGEEFDKVFISFLLHGFPHNIREKITDNAYKVLKDGGEFHILDWNEFYLRLLPFYQRTFFKLIECPYVFDFVRRDWKKILANHNFDDFKEYFFFGGFVRLLKTKKLHRDKI